MFFIKKQTICGKKGIKIPNVYGEGNKRERKKLEVSLW